MDKKSPSSENKDKGRHRLRTGEMKIDFKGYLLKSMVDDGKPYYPE